jgi:hypothetical protein
MVDAMTEKDEVPNGGKQGTEVPKDESVPNLAHEEPESPTSESEDSLKDLRKVPFDELRKKGWKPRIKKKPSGQQYITLQGRIEDDDGKKHTTDRSLGAYTPERWDYIIQFFPEPEETSWATELDVDGLGTEEPPRDADSIGTVEQDVELPRTKDSKMFKTVVSRHGAIPSSITYASDIVVYFEFFQAKGYSGNINDWMHEVVRNYLAEHYCRMHMEMGKPQGELNE